MTSKLLQDVLPIEEPVNTFTIRQHIADVAERLEQEMGDEQFCFVEGCQGLPERIGEGEDQYELRPRVLKDLERISGTCGTAMCFKR